MKTELTITKSGKNVKLRKNIEKSRINTKNFKVGDFVIGKGNPDIYGNDFPYTITTNEGIFKVITILNNDEMLIEIKEHNKYPNHIHSCHDVRKEFFELYVK